MPHQSTASSSRVTNLYGDFPNRALTTTAETWWSVMAECQREIGRFVSERLNKDGEAIRKTRKTLSCNNWTDVLDIQARWVEETLRDYNTEMSKLTGLYARSAASSVRDERHKS